MEDANSPNQQSPFFSPLNTSFVVFSLNLEGTVYWDGYYVLEATSGWEFECDLCFSIKAHIDNMIVIQLRDCSKEGKVRFYFSPGDEIPCRIEIADDYRFELQNATARITYWQ